MKASFLEEKLYIKILTLAKLQFRWTKDIWKKISFDAMFTDNVKIQNSNYLSKNPIFFQEQRGWVLIGYFQLHYTANWLQSGEKSSNSELDIFNWRVNVKKTHVLSDNFLFIVLCRWKTTADDFVGIKVSCKTISWCKSYWRGKKTWRNLSEELSQHINGACGDRVG